MFRQSLAKLDKGRKGIIMTKILFIGDIHGKKANPLDRLCDYNEDQYRKMIWIRDHCITNNIKTIVHLGDIADKPEMPDEWKNKFIEIWKPYISYGKFYTIIGLLHDLFYNRQESYPKTCLYNLELSGVLEVIQTPIIVENSVRLIPMSMFTKEAKEQILDIDNHIECDGMDNILLAHQFYNWTLDKSAGFTEEELMNIITPCSLILGHDHRQYPDDIVGNVTVRRPGSLMRTELSETTIEMKPRVLLYENGQWSYIEVPHRPIEEIYNVIEYQNRKKEVKIFKSLENNLEDISKYFHKENSIIPCSEILAGLHCPKDEFDYLRGVHQVCCQDF